MSEDSQEIDRVGENLRILKTGSYGKVNLVKGENIAAPKEEVKYRMGALSNKIKSWFGGNKARMDEAYAIGDLCHNVANNHRVYEGQLKGIPGGFNHGELLKLGNIIALIANMYGKSVLKARRELGETRPYDLGLTLSDFLEVIPTEVAARILYAASDPEIAQTILQGEGSLNIKDIDIQPHAVEAVVLLPIEPRHKIFTGMADLQPNGGSRAYRLFGLIAANWAQRNSEYCGQIMIYNNLRDEVASRKILEVQEDLSNLGPELRGRI